MYAYIKGDIVAMKDEFIVIENNNVGYRIFCPLSISSRIGRVGDFVCVYTYHYVREDAIALYGFPSEEEYDMFVLLLTVSGIGPKVAMAIVGQFQPAEFSLAVISGDVKTLTGIKGLGKKGAERIVLELKDKLKGFAFRDTDMTSSVSLPSTSEALSSLEEASAALVVLGYPASEALMAVKSVYEDGMSVEEIIPKALRRMVRS